MAGEVEFICECTGENFTTDKYYKLTSAGKFKAYVGTCPGECGKSMESEVFIPENHTKWNPSVPKRKFRDRPEFIPGDLHQKLEEEKRLREEMNKIEQKTKSTSAETHSASECKPVEE